MIIYNNIKYKILLLTGILSAMNGVEELENIPDTSLCIKQDLYKKTIDNQTDPNIAQNALALVQFHLFQPHLGPEYRWLRYELTTARRIYNASVARADRYYTGAVTRAHEALEHQKMNIRHTKERESSRARLSYEEAVYRKTNAKYALSSELECQQIIDNFSQTCEQLEASYIQNQQAAQETQDNALRDAQETRDHAINAAIDKARGQVPAILGISAILGTTSRAIYSGTLVTQ